MGLYADRVLPHLIKATCGNAAAAQQRRKVVPLAYGRVLEVGIGPGLNLEFYDRSKVELIWGLEPSPGMRRLAAPTLDACDLEVRLLDLPGEEIPLDDHSIDSIVLTFTLCTIPDAERALAQMRRVLKPDGLLLFCEHGEAPDESVRRWQRRIEPAWSRVAGGCHLTRPIPQLIDTAGFAVESTSAYVQGPKFASFHSWGSATVR